LFFLSVPCVFLGLSLFVPSQPSSARSGRPGALPRAWTLGFHPLLRAARPFFSLVNLLRLRGSRALFSCPPQAARRRDAGELRGAGSWRAAAAAALVYLRFLACRALVQRSSGSREGAAHGDPRARHLQRLFRAAVASDDLFAALPPPEREPRPAKEKAHRFATGFRFFLGCLFFFPPFLREWQAFRKRPLRRWRPTRPRI
jgi:hypothetical protein